MDYAELLRKSFQETESIACFGMDPVLERIPLEGKPEEVIVKFYTGIRDAFVSEDVMPGAVKPNIAYYEQYGIEGLRALKKVMELFDVPVILDAKRGDIGKSSAAYANNLFDFWGADAITVAPYMGSDSVTPFFRDGKGVYVLCRTSNPGAKDFQDDVYMEVARKINEWGCGAVVGATYPEELGKITKVIGDVPLLIPGVGSQGGSPQEVMEQLEGYDKSLVRINSSSGLNYAYEKEDNDDYAGAAARALKKLNSELKKFL